MAKKDVSKNWKGRQIFLCNDKFIFGGKNSVKEVVFSYGTLIVSAVLYYCFSGLYVAREVSIGVNIMQTSLIIFSAISLLALTFVDPGFVIHGDVEPPSEGNESMNFLQESGDQTGTESDHIELKAMEDSGDSESSNWGSAAERYCKVCKIIRPAKALHCSECNACVRGFDHHCYFTGNCIGHRNMKYFIQLLLVGTSACIIWLFCNIYTIASVWKANPSLSEQFDQNRHLMLYSFFSLVASVLCCFPKILMQMTCFWFPLILSFIFGVMLLNRCQTDLDLPTHQNITYLFLTLLVCAGVLFWFSSMLYFTFNTATRAVIGLDKINRLGRKAMPKLSIKDKVDTFIFLLRRKQPPSEITN